MAKILIPEDGNTRTRNFDEIIVLGRNGQVRKIVRKPDDLVLTVVGGSRKLIYMPTSNKRPAPTWFWPVFWFLGGIWLSRFADHLLAF